jgi:hypothetical protein
MRWAGRRAASGQSLRPAADHPQAFQQEDVGIEAEENGAALQAAGGDPEIVGWNRPAFALRVAVMEGIGIGGVFLWHCPGGRPLQALPGRPCHQGARTFLNRPEQPWAEAPGHVPRIAITSATFQEIMVWNSWPSGLPVLQDGAIQWKHRGCSSAG